MGIRFVLMVNKQGQTRLAQYYEYLTIEERRALEGEIVCKCLARNEQQYRGRLKAKNILSSLHPYIMSAPEEVPLKALKDPKELRMFLDLTDKALVLVDFCGWTTKYTEMVDDIIRSQAEKLQPANELTRTRLKEMELPDSILALEGNLTIPAHLREEEQIGCNWFWSIG
ncbi:hypothetical protein K1719_000799 [Acacia pycnantha]|nr:hypothetical protein K1719_000799 [Acacia pycnantha]